MFSQSQMVVMMVGLVLTAWTIVGLTAAQGAMLEVVVNTGADEFTPQRVMIRAGDKVTWVNQDQRLHSLVSAGLSSRQATSGADEPFINTVLPSGTSYTKTFAQPGIYHYFCADHMQVWGVVVAEE